MVSKWHTESNSAGFTWVCTAIPINLTEKCPSFSGLIHGCNRKWRFICYLMRFCSVYSLSIQSFDWKYWWLSSLMKSLLGQKTVNNKYCLLNKQLLCIMHFWPVSFLFPIWRILELCIILYTIQYIALKRKKFLKSISTTTHQPNGSLEIG